MNPILLTTGDLTLASLLIVAGAALSLAMSLGIHRACSGPPPAWWCS